jgi:hypothetical protein
MNKKYEEMMNNIIRKFGFEDTHTIIFCGLIENNADEQTIYETYDEYMDLLILDSDEEDE